MTNAAWPDDEGTRNAIGRLMTNARTANQPCDVPDTASSSQWSIVSMM